jgi:hypothetical protein
MTGKRQSNDNVRQARRSEADLGQKEAEVEKASEEQLRHMEGGDAVESARQRKAKEADLGQEEAGLEKASKEELRHMEGGDAVESSPQQKAKSQSK